MRHTLAGNCADLHSALIAPCVFLGHPKLVLVSVSCAQGFLYPWVDQTLSSSSLYLFSDGYFLTLKQLVWFRQQYLSKPEDSVNVLASPLLATLEQLTNFPPSLIITAEFDPLRDEGEAFAAKLTSAGVDVTLTRYVDRA